MGRRFTGRVCVVCLHAISGSAVHVDISTADGKLRGGYLACSLSGYAARRGCALKLRAEHPDAAWYEDNGSVGLVPRKESAG